VGADRSPIVNVAAQYPLGHVYQIDNIPASPNRETGAAARW